jgi:hypothetical protein
VAATISGKDEYLLYRKVLKDRLLGRKELQEVDMKTVLKAREEGILLLRSNKDIVKGGAGILPKEGKTGGQTESAPVREYEMTIRAQAKAG